MWYSYCGRVWVSTCEMASVRVTLNFVAIRAVTIWIHVAGGGGGGGGGRG